jgi:hypothetical protein
MILAALLFGVSFSVVMPNGTKLTLTAISDGQQAWSPSGDSLSKLPLPQHWQEVLKPSGAPLPNRMVYVRTESSTVGMPSFAIQIPPAPTSAFGSTLLDDDSAQDPKKRQIWYGFTSIDRTGKTADVRIGLAEGKWSKVEAIRYRGAPLKGSKFLHAVHIGKPPHSSKSVVVEATYPSVRAKNAYRIEAYDKKGKEFLSGGSMSRPGKTYTEYWFDGDLRSLGRIELQSRPYTWTTFKGVPLDRQ